MTVIFLKGISMLRRAFTIAVFLLLASNAAAYTKFQFDVTDGSTTAVASLSGATTKALKTCPGATVAVYLTGTSTLATIYSTEAGAAKSNPFTASNSARATFWISSATYDFAFSGGGCSTHTWTGIVAGSDSFTVSVTGMGAACDGVTNDTAVFQAAADLTGSHRVSLPDAVCLVTNEILITQDRVSWVGQGKQTSVINFVPTADDKAALHYDSAGAAVNYQGSVRDLTIKSTDTTYRKFAIRCTDCSEFDVENVAVYPFEGGPDISPFTGGSSSGLYLEGREIGSFRNLEISADIPVRIGNNPNSTIDIDHHNFENLYLAAAGNTPNVWIESGVNLTNVMFGGYQAWVLGKFGLYWVDTTSTLPSSGLSISNMRHEQPTARGWIVDIEHNQALYGFRLLDSYGGGGTAIDGVKLRKVRRTRLDSYSYNGTGVALDIDSTDTEGVEGRNIFAQTGSTISTTGLTKVWSVGPPLGGGYPTWSTFRYDPPSNGSFAAGYCFELMGLNKCGGSGTLADTATVAFPTLGNTAGRVGRITVVVSGATKHASCTLSYDAAAANIESTTNAADCTKGNVAGAFGIDWSGSGSSLLRNNLGESAKYWYEVTQIP